MANQDYRKHYQQGAEQATAGQGKRPIFTAFKRIIKPDAYLFGGGFRVSESLRGYNDGYEDTVRNKPVHLQGTQQQSTNTYPSVSQPSKGASNVSIQRQIDLLESLRKHLVELCDELQDASKQYELALDYLHTDEGLHLENYNGLKEDALEPTKVSIKLLVEQLEEDDIKLIDTLISELSGSRYYS